MSGSEISVPSNYSSYVSNQYDSLLLEDDNEDGRVNLRIYGEEDGVVCLPLEDAESGGVPTGWRMSFARGETEPPQLADPERIDKLESLLERKNQTIEQLRTQLNTTESGGDVTIDVTVSPGGGQQAFLEGGEALIEAQAQDVDFSELKVKYGSGTYSLNTSGQVVVPLVDTGEQSMEFVYEDASEQVSIDVQSPQTQEQEPTTTATEAATSSSAITTAPPPTTATSEEGSLGDIGDEKEPAPSTETDSGSGVDGPGFGFPMAVLAITLLTLVAIRAGGN